MASTTILSYVDIYTIHICEMESQLFGKLWLLGNITLNESNVFWILEKNYYICLAKTKLRFCMENFKIVSHYHTHPRRTPTQLIVTQLETNKTLQNLTIKHTICWHDQNERKHNWF